MCREKVLDRDKDVEGNSDSGSVHLGDCFHCSVGTFFLISLYYFYDIIGPLKITSEDCS